MPNRRTQFLRRALLAQINMSYRPPGIRAYPPETCPGCVFYAGGPVRGHRHRLQQLNQRRLFLASCSARRRSLISRTNALKLQAPPTRTGQTVASTGNSWPSRCKATRSIARFNWDPSVVVRNFPHHARGLRGMREQQRYRTNGASDHFRGGPSEGQLGLRIPSRDGAVGVHADERVVGRLEDHAVVLVLAPAAFPRCSSGP